MIDIVKQDYRQMCNACHSNNDVKELYFRASNQGVVVALCKECRNELKKLLVSEERKGN